MSERLSRPPRLWQTIFLLLRAAWKRSIGQQRRQRQLLRSRGGGANLGSFGYLISFAFGVAVHGSAAFGVITAVHAADRPGRSAFAHDFTTALWFGGGRAAMLGSILLLWWFLMLVCQGEGIELDLQRRRHPMWEWLFSHPIKPAAVFIAEMLSPLVANPLYLTAPLYVGILYGAIHGLPVGILGGLLIGLPITVAAAFLGKAVEIAVMLRFSLRVRGAVLGVLGWFGYSSMLLLFLSGFGMAGMIDAVGSGLDPLSTLPWPWLGLMLGEQSDGSFSFAAGMLTCWLGAGVVATGAVWFSVWGAGRGLVGETSRSQPVAASHGVSRLIRNPLYRKELLWFRRDPSAVVQTILIPLTLAGFQLINLRGALHAGHAAWNVLCAAAILFGTYFLWVLGPRSLASEGAALWIALSWPPGLENLLKAKARLWTVIASAMVGLVLCYAAIRFPDKLWQIALVGVGWCLFARSMAEKSVTLVTVTSSSGEIQKVPRSRYWATQLGMVTFAIGVLSQQWTVALTGIVYSAVTAAAMWQNLRARLPYLYDPWSEKLPEAPTLMHVMIAISIAVDFGAIVIGIVAGVGGSAAAAVYRPTVFGFSGLAAAIGLVAFLYGRGVTLGDVVTWRSVAAPDWRRRLSFLLMGIVGGLVLGIAAHGYLALLQLLPITSQLVPHTVESPAAYWTFGLGGVLLAPLGEEYLFRGVLFRALDREWGGWQAVLGSAAFFAIYHPPIAWLPVGLVGVLNALLFRRSRWLVAPVALHMAYNATMLIQ